jgi:phage terminase small subunit
MDITDDSLRRGGLLPRQERFARAFVVTGVLSKAARLAGYSERRARKTGWELYRLPAVRARIDELEAENCRAFELQFASSFTR